MKKWPIALQVYSVRDFAEKDTYDTFKQIKEMGYDGVELAGTYGKSVAEIKAMLDEIGLELVSAHVGLEGLEDAENLEAYAATGMKYIAIPGMKLPENAEELKQVVARMRNAAELCKAKGMQLSYHNHAREFDKIDGRYMLDAFYEEIPADLLQAELDLCWVRVGGEDPAAYLRKYAGRAPVVHVKDYVDVDNGAEDVHDRSEQRPVGYGTQDVPGLLAAAEEAGTQWLVVEQDALSSMGRNSLQCSAMSVQYLKTI